MERATAALQRRAQQRRRHFPEKNRRQICHVPPLGARHVCGVLLLDRDNPETILYRSETPILTPVTDYERFGKVPNVVFSCGNVLINDEVLVYYGGADSVMCVATYELNELVPKK